MLYDTMTHCMSRKSLALRRRHMMHGLKVKPILTLNPGMRRRLM